MRIQSFICDVCQKQKEQVNGWFIAERTKVGLSLHTWTWAEVEDELDTDGAGDGVVRVHLCGQQCGIVKLSEWLGELNGPLLEQYKQRLQDLGELK